MGAADRGVVYSFFAACYPVEEEEKRRILGEWSSMRRESAERVDTHRDLRILAVEKASV